jgi:hypothetical protein
VLVIDEENGPVLLKMRLARMLTAAGSNVDGSECDIEFLSMAGVNLSSRKCVAALEKMMHEVCPDLVIIDTLIRVHQGNESTSEDMAPISKILQRLCNAYKCAICFNHHNRKPGAGGHDGQHAYRGSSEIQALVDSHLDLKAEKGEPGVLRVRHEKSRFAKEVKPFGVEIVDQDQGTVVRHTEVRQTIPMTKQDEAEDFIRKLLSDGPRLSRIHLLETGQAAGHARNTLDTARKAMVGSGELSEGIDRGRKYVCLEPSSCSDHLIGEEEESQVDSQDDLREVRVS